MMKYGDVLQILFQTSTYCSGILEAFSFIFLALHCGRSVYHFYYYY